MGIKLLNKAFNLCKGDVSVEQENANAIVVGAFYDICDRDEPFYIGVFDLYSRVSSGCMDEVSKAWRTLEKDDPDIIDFIIGQFLG
ncbi:hypothetical protein LZY01_20030 [Levilactobacillus zymae]|uniref:Uncharacterized protein n=1 Tax=Levilactobacillus zymae TaxID=267363 RepID=A0ABQ0WY56_9LACO|nr:hypothetical protein [Levilactobacillus zymae]QFR61029.1 hypothetical protein LZ395_05575 [Levilactobacillus zymae]GEO72835.1 hypothetical protein LZY01_20030 [Levilactobacillus zymae]